MIFSVSYHSANKQKAGEIRCPYNHLGSVFDFIKNNTDKRYNIIIDKDLSETEFKKAIEQIEFVKGQTENYTVECRNIATCTALLEEGYNTYIKYPVSDWETFMSLLLMGVSDIYVDGPLCFQSERLLHVKTQHNINIRVSPTVSANAALSKDKSKTFFIRPEDLKLYTFIDIIDFHYNNQEQEDALFSIYTRGTFNFDINQLVNGLPAVNNLMFKEDFAERRLNCGQVCNVPQRSCRFCPNYFLFLERVPAVVEVTKSTN